jgi:3'-5' exoribonuclease
MINFVKELESQAKTYGVIDYVYPVIDDPFFNQWSGSGSGKHHHYGDGGLCKHTYEVWMLSRSIIEQYRCYNVEPYKALDMNSLEVFISVIWHDYGKIWDYQKDDNGVWGKHNNHARQIHHISRSALEFEKHMVQLKSVHRLKADINNDNIVHNILSHHGMREWGSPVAPATREAWILHLADNLSARLDDSGKHDILDH